MDIGSAERCAKTARGEPTAAEGTAGGATNSPAGYGWYTAPGQPIVDPYTGKTISVNAPGAGYGYYTAPGAPNINPYTGLPAVIGNSGGKGGSDARPTPVAVSRAGPVAEGAASSGGSAASSGYGYYTAPGMPNINQVLTGLPPSTPGILTTTGGEPRTVGPAPWPQSFVAANVEPLSAVTSGAYNYAVNPEPAANIGMPASSFYGDYAYAPAPAAVPARARSRRSLRMAAIPTRRRHKAQVYFEHAG